MTAVETLEYKGFTIEIHYDDHPDNPRNWDNLGTMCGYNREWNFPWEEPLVSPRLVHDDMRGEEESGWEQVEKELIGLIGLHILIPWQIIDHGPCCRIEFLDDDSDWKRRAHGVYFATLGRALRLTPTDFKNAQACLKSELYAYGLYLNGNVYAYRIMNRYGTEIDACYGMMDFDENGSDTGTEYALSEAKEAVEHLEVTPEQVTRARQDLQTTVTTLEGATIAENSNT